MTTDSNQDKQKVADVFNLVASGYDHPSLRFFPLCADTMVHFLHPEPDCKILDIATGTGVAAVAAGKQLGSQGRVHAIDLSAGMIEKATDNVEKMALNNIDFHLMDAEKLEFKDNYFDYAMCAFGLFFLPDIQAALKQFFRVLKTNGRLVFTSFNLDSFQPMADIFRTQMEEYGIKVENPAWYKLNTRQQCEQLLSDVGAINIEVHEKQMGYYLNSEQDWWPAMWNSGWRGYLEQLTAEQLEQFQKQHLDSVRELVTDKGLWLDVTVLFALGEK